MPSRAIVRDVSPWLVDAELTYVRRQPVDVPAARRQHEVYCQTLRDLGLEVVQLPPAPDLPDGMFVEDIAVVFGDLVVLTRPGAASRRPEVRTAEPVIAALGRTVTQIAAPATLDGGDVLQIGDTVYVGLSQRSNMAAVAHLSALLRPRGRRVVPVRVTGALHLKTAATALPDGAVLAVTEWLDVAPLQAEVIDAPEPEGANVLVIDDRVVVSASAPDTARLVAARGFEVISLDIAELEKCEAGLTCLSVLV